MTGIMKKNRSTKSQDVAKSTPVEPVPQGSGPLHRSQEASPKRGPGRPRKVDLAELGSGSATFADAKKLTDKGTDPKALITFRRMIADAEKEMMTPADYDGGGTLESTNIVTKDSLQKRVTRRLNVLDRFLTDDKLIELLAFSSLKEVGIYEGILLDKSQVLSGNPNVIIGSEDRARINEVMPRLLTEMKRRGLITTLSERKIEFTNPE